MKIDSPFKPTPAPVSNRPATTRPNTSPAASTEAVSLSPLASTMQGNEKPPINTARIQEIKAAISEGRFKINPEAIADSLIETARDLVNSQRKA
jgi:negative regulator of flagellin synthesis FlgM